MFVSYFANLHIHGLVQERRNSSALAMELRLSFTNPLISKVSENLKFFVILGA